jgi:protocatechuate 3,4-dioxygenase beta subunit
MRLIAGICAIALLACNAESAGSAREKVVGLPCEGCEWVFTGMPDSIASSARIAPAGEPGEPMRIDGTVRDLSGHPVAGIIIYAYHTDAAGIYPRDDVHHVRHGRLRAWARSDSGGRYRFETIRPAGYPGTDLPQHVHMHVIEPGRCTYWIEDIQFDDDPRMTDGVRARLRAGRAGNGLAVPVRKDGIWLVTRDIVLGENIPGYPARN